MSGEDASGGFPLEHLYLDGETGAVYAIPVAPEAMVGGALRLSRSGGAETVAIDAGWARGFMIGPEEVRASIDGAMGERASALVEALEGLLGIAVNDSGALPHAIEYLRQRFAARDESLKPGLDRFMAAIEGLLEPLYYDAAAQALGRQLRQVQGLIAGLGSGADPRELEGLLAGVLLLLAEPERGPGGGGLVGAPEVPERVITEGDLIDLSIFGDEALEFEVPDFGPSALDPDLVARTMAEMERELAAAIPTEALDSDVGAESGGAS